MTKKIISIVAIVAVLTVGYFVVKNGNFNQINTQTEDSTTKPSEEEIANLPLPGSVTDDTAELIGEIILEAKRSFNSTGFGAVQLVDHTGKEYYCNLIDAEKCDYGYNYAVAIKLVAIPAQGSDFDGWLSGCDNIATTNLKNDTCGVTVYKSKRIAEVRFTVI